MLAFSLLAIAAALAALLSWRPDHATEGRLRELRARRDRLVPAAEAALAARFPQALREDRSANVMLAVSDSFLRSVVERVVPAYLSPVRLDLVDLEVEDSGDLHTGTPLGDLELGDWHLRLTLREARGILRAGKPELRFEEGKVLVRQPFELSEGQVRGRLAFRWDSSGVTNVVCRDFETAVDVEGRAIPREYAANGAFLVGVDDGVITVRPDFGRPRFRLVMEANDRTWQAARAALEDEDGLLECGLAMDPADVIDRLHELVARGFEIELPRELFRSVRWPARLSETVGIQGKVVRLEVRSPSARVSDQHVIYQATAQLQAGSGPSPDPGRPDEDRLPAEGAPGAKVTGGPVDGDAVSPRASRAPGASR